MTTLALQLLRHLAEEPFYLGNEVFRLVQMTLCYLELFVRQVLIHLVEATVAILPRSRHRDVSLIACE